MYLWMLTDNSWGTLSAPDYDTFSTYSSCNCQSVCCGILWVTRAVHCGAVICTTLLVCTNRVTIKLWQVYYYTMYRVQSVIITMILRRVLVLCFCTTELSYCTQVSYYSVVLLVQYCCCSKSGWLCAVKTFRLPHLDVDNAWGPLAGQVFIHDHSTLHTTAALSVPLCSRWSGKRKSMRIINA